MMGEEEELKRKEEGERFIEEEVDDEEVELPGFRFHPTDEELVGFYLKRQLDKKPIKIELIKQIDIYKYDPWDLPSMSIYICVCVLLLHSQLLHISHFL